MARTRTHVFYCRTGTFTDALYRLACALYRRACSRTYVFDSLARALDRRAGACAYVSYSRSCTLTDLANGAARSLSYVCYR